MIFFKFPDQSFYKFRLTHAFPSGNGNSSSAFLIKINVLQTGVNDLLQVFLFSFMREGTLRTIFDALQASGTGFIVNVHSFVKRNGMLGADVDACLTLNAFFFIIKNLDIAAL